MKPLLRIAIYVSACLIALVAMAIFSFSSPSDIAPTKEGRTTSASAPIKHSAAARENATFVLGHRKPIEQLENELWQQSLKSGSIIANGLEESFDVKVIDATAFTRALMGDLHKTLSQEMRSTWVDIYLEAFSEQELSDMAKFYKIDGLQETLTHSIPLFIKSNLALAREHSKLKADLTAHQPLFASLIAPQLSSFAKLAEIIEREDIIQIEDPAYRAEIAKALRSQS